MKRLVDVCLVLLTLPVTLPLMLVIAVLIRITSAGPVFLRLSCVGLDGVVFRQYRFRMIHTDLAARQTGLRVRGLSSPDQRASACSGERHLTPVGAILLVTGLNRLPQIFNILKGEMSLIGPAAVSVAAIGRDGQPDSRLFSVRPGLVSPELFALPEQNLTESERLALSLAYASCAGVGTDGRLLLRSAARALRRR